MSAAGFDLGLLVGSTSHRLQGLGIHTPPTQEGITQIKSPPCRSTQIKASTAGNVFTNPGSRTPEASEPGYPSAQEKPPREVYQMR